MPTYEYVCRACDEGLEAVQSFSDDPLTVCPSCGGELRKVFRSVGIAFKGTGFYRNDSRAKSPTAKSSESKSSTETAAPSTTKEPASNGANKPAPSSTPSTSPSPSTSA